MCTDENIWEKKGTKSLVKYFYIDLELADDYQEYLIMVWPDTQQKLFWG